MHLLPITYSLAALGQALYGLSPGLEDGQAGICMLKGLTGR